ncbi:hypothetical protein CIHG_04843 [Coccidioides immitis H538.4]|uniref:Uncharacterized protein n=3 Tax=Coccidioides immitis TaxID=5501 RepID=A0A0J8QPG1_COCIT|nr:hypothetical protein CIRG_05353 [Coccidioides immitis RMSCC 2394]KMU74404.1 hypothetical protein CISG_04477 [Coccidioides immitis RMSCC 3703]KMU86904.1 hypothetical protein CIHG_04843 [Coccidioides immitis H538.4]
MELMLSPKLLSLRRWAPMVRLPSPRQLQAATGASYHAWQCDLLAADQGWLKGACWSGQRFHPNNHELPRVQPVQFTWTSRRSTASDGTHVSPLLQADLLVVLIPAEGDVGFAVIHSLLQPVGCCIKLDSLSCSLRPFTSSHPVTRG